MDTRAALEQSIISSQESRPNKTPNTESKIFHVPFYVRAIPSKPPQDLTMSFGNSYNGGRTKMVRSV